jgi:hypothetical protein
MSVIVSQITLIGCRPARIARCSAVANPSRTKASSISIVKPCATMIGSRRRRAAAPRPWIALPVFGREIFKFEGVAYEHYFGFSHSARTK